MRHPRLILSSVGLVGLLLIACGGTTTSVVVPAGNNPPTSDPAPAPPLPAPTGMLTGTLTDEGTNAPIAGAVVRALKSRSDTGKGVPLTGLILAEATTGADGSYALAGIPLDQSFRIASMPAQSGAVYDVSASGSLMLTEYNRSIQSDLQGRRTDQFGSTSLTVPATTSWAFTLYLYQVVTQQTGEEGLLVRKVAAPAGATVVQDSLAAGDYLAVLVGVVPTGMGGISTRTARVTVTAGGTAILDPIAYGGTL